MFRTLLVDTYTDYKYICIDCITKIVREPYFLNLPVSRLLLVNLKIYKNIVMTHKYPINDIRH